MKAIIPLVVLAVIVFAGVLLANWLRNHNRRLDRGLDNSGSQIKQLQRDSGTQLAALREIRQLAADSFINTADPMFEVIMQKADKVLDEKGMNR